MQNNVYVKKYKIWANQRCDLLAQEKSIVELLAMQILFYSLDVTLRNNSPQNSAYVFGLAIWSTQKAVRDMKDKHPQRKSLNLVFISTIMNTGTYSYLKWHSVLNMQNLISQYWESRDRTGSVFHSFLPFWNRRHDARWAQQRRVRCSHANGHIRCSSNALIMSWQPCHTHASVMQPISPVTSYHTPSVE